LIDITFRITDGSTKDRNARGRPQKLIAQLRVSCVVGLVCVVVADARLVAPPSPPPPGTDANDGDDGTVVVVVVLLSVFIRMDENMWNSVAAAMRTTQQKKYFQTFLRIFVTGGDNAFLINKAFGVLVDDNSIVTIASSRCMVVWLFCFTVSENS
jgi:hypothetical protein